LEIDKAMHDQLNDKRETNEVERKRLQVIDGKRNRRRYEMGATGMNLGVRASVIRVAIDSDMDEVPTMRKAANRAGVKEPQAMAVVRQYVQDLRLQIFELKSRIQPPPSGPAGMRRAA
jgi:hypothetical protein